MNEKEKDFLCRCNHFHSAHAEGHHNANITAGACRLCKCPYFVIGVDTSFGSNRERWPKHDDDDDVSDSVLLLSLMTAVIVAPMTQADGSFEQRREVARERARNILDRCKETQHEKRV